MQFQFDANQEYQVQAIEAVANLFEDQPPVAAGEMFGVVANRLDLDESDLLANLQRVQQESGITPDSALAYIESAIGTAQSESESIRFPNFSIEMETGTGKTYVYIRTALELYRRYGWRKYIIVVPTVAVREGVLKTLSITRQHLAELFCNIAYNYYTYDSDNLGRVRAFAIAGSVELMVMTIDSFNKASNIFRQSTDRLMGATPMHLVQDTRPILILDEPQNMESEKSVQALAALHPLFALRYSATHRNPYNLVYRLTPAEAYRQGLVKRIEVAGMVEQNDTSQAYVRVDDIETKKNTVTARLAIHKLMKDGTVKEQNVIVRLASDLEELAGRTEYAGFVVEEISVTGAYVRFVNGIEVQRGIARGPDREAIFRAQIRYTIEEHFRRQARLRERGIKVLSLFFIDRVDNYAPAEGIIRRLFERAFDELKRDHPEWRDVDGVAVHKGYFAQRKIKGNLEVIDSLSGKTEADEATFDLIMKEKERLLSFEEPVAFVFSHSALREGWDNPNVFQICTLNQTTSEVKKRQEVGRGMRLAVNESGERVREDQVNVLTVVANDSYERYVSRLQQEIEDEFGRESLPPKAINARKKEQYTTRLRKAYVLKPEFQDLWNRIRQKTRYAVHIDTPRLIADVLPEVNAIRVRLPRLAVTKARVDIAPDDRLQATPMTATRTAATLEPQAPLPNLLALIENLMTHTTPPVRVTRRTILEILRQSTTLPEAMKNPQEYATQIVRILKEKLADQLAEGIQYVPIKQWYDLSQLQDEIFTSKQLIEARKSVYEKVICDSGPEERFVAGLEQHDAVTLYIKLPGWFTVDTPIGEYNPDWAIVMEDRDEHGKPTGQSLYLVRETKSTLDLDELRKDEKRKILCGARHFAEALGTSYQVVTSASQLPNDGLFPPRV